MRIAAGKSRRRACLAAGATLIALAAVDGSVGAEPGIEAAASSAAATTAAPGVSAAAPPSADALGRMLIDKGLLSTAGASSAAGNERLKTAAAAPSMTTPARLLRKARDRAADMVFAAMNFVGVRYRRGGDSADSGFDCSGFTRYVYETSLGLVLPRRADEQASAAGLVTVPRSDLKPGDLVFFNTMKRTFSHVGIYVGDNRFIHAPRSGKDIRTDSLDLAYWAQRFTGARRAEAATESDFRQ